MFSGDTGAWSVLASFYAGVGPPPFESERSGLRYSASLSTRSSLMSHVRHWTTALRCRATATAAPAVRPRSLRQPCSGCISVAMSHSSSSSSPRISAARRMVTAEAGAAMSGGAGDRDCVAPIPRQQRGQIGDLVIGDSSQHIGKPGLGIDVVELGRLNQRQHDRGALAAAV